VGFVAVTVTAGIAALGSPVGAGTAIAVPAPVVSVAATATASPGAPDPSVAASARRIRESRDTARAELTTAARQQAVKRDSMLGQQGAAIAAQQQQTIKTDQAKARAKVEAAAVAKAAAEARATAEAKAAAVRRAAAEARARTEAKARASAVARAEAQTRAAAVAASRRAAAARAEANKKAAAATKNRGYTSSTTDPRDIAKQILANRYGFGPEQYSCFNYIIMRESMWDVNATNRSSGAYGIPQALPGSKMASAGSDWRTNPATQITWAVGYMNDRYGSPCAAKVFKAANGWY